MEPNSEVLKKLPGVDILLATPKVRKMAGEHGSGLVKYCIRNVLQALRDDALEKGFIPPQPEIIELIGTELSRFTSRSLRKVFNATGIVVHTNLGRAPFSREIIEETAKILTGYNNLEFDLETGKRKTRYFHITELLKYLTGAEDVLVVNNNAAAVMMILRAFARDQQVIVSRGELIEIGGSFRLPEIMAASDCKMVEVGTTNKTRIEDYEDRINENTALLFKAHRSNYVIRGFTQEASLPEMVALGRKYKIPVVYDMGSGLLHRTSVRILNKEPDVKQTLELGVDLVTFSGDKLLGAAQAGIIAGNREMVAKLRKEPILRALRVGKTTLALLESALHHYINEKELVRKNNIFNMLTRKPEELKVRAENLNNILLKNNVTSIVVESEAYCGGGALPDEAIRSYSVRIEKELSSNKLRSGFAEKMYYGLMAHPSPVVGILKKGYIDFDILTIPDEEIRQVGEIISQVYNNIR